MARGISKIAALFAIIGVSVMPIRFAAADSIWTVYDMTNSPLPTNLVASIDFDDAGNQYIGTTGGGLVLKQDMIWTVWDESNTGVPIGAVRHVERDSPGNLWVAATSGDLNYGIGLAHLEAMDSSWTMQNDGLEASQIVSGIVIYGDVRYVSTYGGGLTIFDAEGWIRYRYTSRTEFNYAEGQQEVFSVPAGTYLPSDYIREIDIDRSAGILWMAIANGGAVSFDGAEWITYNSDNSGLPSDQLLTVDVNPYNGDVYFGTAGFGVAVKSGTLWTVYDSSNSPMPDGYISAIEVRPGDGELWLGTGYGVWVLQTDGFWRSYIPPENDFIWGDFYSDISFDSVGSVWVSAYDGGMASLWLGSQPPPPDTLYIDVNRIFIYFYNNRPVERIFTDIDVTGAPELTADDSISFRLDSDLGELYSFGITFSEFKPGDPGQDGRTSYRYKYDKLMVVLAISNDDPSDIEVTIKDMDAEMNRDNYQNTLTVTMGMAGVVGSQVIFLSGGNQWDVPEMHGEETSGTAQIFGYDNFTTGIDDDRIPLAAELELINYPNPFNGRTNISFNLAGEAAVDIAIYDLLGRLVGKLHSGNLPAGTHRFGWPTRSDESELIKSGIYIYRLSVNGVSVSKKMLYLK